MAVQIKFLSFLAYIIRVYQVDESSVVRSCSIVVHKIFLSSCLMLTVFPHLCLKLACDKKVNTIDYKTFYYGCILKENATQSLVVSELNSLLVPGFLLT